MIPVKTAISYVAIGVLVLVIATLVNNWIAARMLKNAAAAANGENPKSPAPPQN
jgi:hypothetical protein